MNKIVIYYYNNIVKKIGNFINYLENLDSPNFLFSFWAMTALFNTCNNLLLTFRKILLMSIFMAYSLNAQWRFELRQ